MYIITIQINCLVKISRRAQIWHEVWHLLTFDLEDHKTIFTTSKCIRTRLIRIQMTCILVIRH